MHESNYLRKRERERERRKVRNGGKNRLFGDKAAREFKVAADFTARGIMSLEIRNRITDKRRIHAAKNSQGLDSRPSSRRKVGQMSSSRLLSKPALP